MLSGSSLSCRSPPCSHTAISSTSLTVLLQASDLVRHMLFPTALNPSPPQFDLRAVRCHLLVLPFLQNFHQLTVAHSACMCHNLFAVIFFTQLFYHKREAKATLLGNLGFLFFRAILLQPLFFALYDSVFRYSFRLYASAILLASR